MRIRVTHIVEVLLLLVRRREAVLTDAAAKQRRRHAPPERYIVWVNVLRETEEMIGTASKTNVDVLK